jgi:hypothetical protein
VREIGTDQAVLNEPQKTTLSEPQGRKLIARYWGELVVVIIALLLWVPRLSGPIDLRWDGSVYYLLGTSLVQGHGYRIPSEPGSPQALQYPPLLPAMVALHEWALNSIDPGVVAPWLRKTYAAVFLSYGVATLALAKRYLSPVFAVIAVALCLLHHMTIFLSDLLFAELPFAAITVAFALVAIAPLQGSGWKGWSREAAAFALAAAGFFLKTAGVVLFAAWVLVALTQRRWRVAIARGALALLSFLTWQVYIANTLNSADYAHPAYEYQRAGYQYANVTYAENASLLNPFRPELGRLNLWTFTERLEKNLPQLAVAVGESLSARADTWPLRRIEKYLPGSRKVSKAAIPASAQVKSAFTSVASSVSRPEKIALIPILMLFFLACSGLVIIIQRREWLFVFIVVGSLGLVWLTPWRIQFTRYVTPLMPFLAICLLLGYAGINATLHSQKLNRIVRVILQFGLATLLLLCFLIHALAAPALFRTRAGNQSVFTAAGIGQQPRFFAHDRSWQEWEEAVNWIESHAPANVVVATSAPHLFYLLTKRKAVLPPMEIDPVRERQLLKEVPVSYLIVDQLEALDVTRRYAMPAVAADPNWQLMQSTQGARIYQRQTD